MRVFTARDLALTVGLILVAAALPAAEAPGAAGPAGRGEPKPPGEKPASGKRPKAAGDTSSWLPLDEGLAKVRSELLPAAVFYRGPAPIQEAEGAAGTDRAAAMAAVLRDPVVAKALRKMVVLAIGPEDLRKAYPVPPHEKAAEKKAGEKEAAVGPEAAAPGPDRDPAPAAPDVGTRLGIFAERPSLVLLDFRERVVGRFEDELPTRHKLAKELDRLVKVQRVQAAEARRAEKAVADARYAAGLGKQREAVLAIRPFEAKDLQARLEPVALGRVNAVIAEFRDLAKKGMQAADKLESQRKFTEAIQTYDAVAAKFPFQDLIQHCSKRKGEILRKMTYGF